MLKLKDLSYHVDGRPVLSSLTGAWPADAAIALLGASGSGKSTLLKLIAGFIQPSAGEIHLHGTIHSGNGTHVPPHRRRVGMAFQNTALWPHMTVREALTFVARAHDRIGTLLDSFELADLADRKPHQLSGGQAQCVNLARAMAMEPDILLLDEPFTGMDPLLKTLLVDRMRTLLDQKKTLLIIATHYAQEALPLVREIVLLKEGCLQFRGDPLTMQTFADPYVRGFIQP